jgi:hypothetical protein
MIQAKIKTTNLKEYFYETQKPQRGDSLVEPINKHNVAP